MVDSPTGQVGCVEFPSITVRCHSPSGTSWNLRNLYHAQFQTVSCKSGRKYSCAIWGVFAQNVPGGNYGQYEKLIQPINRIRDYPHMQEYQHMNRKVCHSHRHHLPWRKAWTERRLTKRKNFKYLSVYNASYTALRTLTQNSTTLLEKPIVSHIVKYFLKFYRT